MSKYKIAIFEFDYHEEVLRNFCHIADQDSFEIMIFTRDRLWSNVNIDIKVLKSRFSVFQLKKGESMYSFFDKHISKINTADVILFNTLASDFKFFSRLSLKPPIILRIHNTNSYFNKFWSSFSPKLSLFYIWKDLSHLIRKTIFEMNWLNRREFVNKVDYYAFPTQFLRDYAINTYGLDAKKAIVLPMSYAPEEKEILEEPIKNISATTISVIGRIDPRNRDYISIYNSFKLALKKVNRPIVFNLLGSCNSEYGRKVKKLFISLSSDRFKLNSFDSFVDQNTFSKCINASDFLIIPIKRATRHTIYTEYYGYTKISGSINDIIKYRKPALIDKIYPLAESLEPAVRQYSGEEDLAHRLIDWSNNKKYLRRDVQKAVSAYKIEKVQDDFYTNLRAIL